MAGIALTLFGGSLAGIIGLFALKSWEHTHQRELFPETRRAADRHALKMKRRGMLAISVIEHLPSFVVWALRFIVHLIAVSAARFARWTEHRAHRLADLVSYKSQHTRQRSLSAKTARTSFLQNVQKTDRAHRE